MKDSETHPAKSAELSDFLAALERAYDDINRELFESALSTKPVITIAPTPGAYGHFTTWKAWEGEGGEGRYEINLGAEDINRPAIDVMATLVHEMCHQYCQERDLKDTSRSGTYHNKTFREVAEAHGLSISYDKRIGWSETKPGKGLLAMEERGAFAQVENSLHRKGGARKDPATRAASSTRKYVCPDCGMSVRATREVRVMCMDCELQMETD